jgi:hypothetical protein
MFLQSLASISTTKSNVEIDRMFAHGRATLLHYALDARHEHPYLDNRRSWSFRLRRGPLRTSEERRVPLPRCNRR